MEVRELLDLYKYDGEGTPIVRGSALCALEDREPEIGAKAIVELMNQVRPLLPHVTVTPRVTATP